MSLLSIVQGSMLRCSMPVPSSAFANPDPTVQQFVAYAQDAGDELAERWTWSNLKRPIGGARGSFTGDGVTTVFNMPSDWARLSPSDTFTSSIYPTLVLRGPMNEDDLLRLKALPFVPLPSVWRLIGTTGGQTQIEFWPAPANGEVISYVYGSWKWITDLNGNVYANPVWQADSDLSLIAERLIRLGAIWRWKKAKGLVYDEEFRLCESAFDRRAGQESQGREIDTTRWRYGEVAPWWPGTITDLTDHNYG